MPHITKFEHDKFLAACADPGATEEEKSLLSYCASMWAAGYGVPAKVLHSANITAWRVLRQIPIRNTAS